MIKKYWNVFLPIFIAVAVIIVLCIKRDSLTDFISTLQSASLPLIICAFFCLFGRYFTHAYAYKAIFNCVEEKVSYFQIVPLVFSVTFANDCVPSAGASGSVLIATWAYRRGINAGKSLSIVFLEKLGYYGGFAVVMLAGYVIFIATGHMTWYLIAGGAAIFLMTALTVVLFILAHVDVNKLGTFLNWCERAINKVIGMFKRPPMKPWADRMTKSFAKTALLVFSNPKRLVIMFVRMIGLHLFDAACFCCVALAFGVTDFSVMYATYVAGFIISNFVLQTIGAVELLMAFIMMDFGVNGFAATAIALCYRGLIFWVPFAIGAVCVNITGKSKKKKSEHIMDEVIDKEQREDFLKMVKENREQLNKDLQDDAEMLKREAKKQFKEEEAAVNKGNSVEEVEVVDVAKTSNADDSSKSAASEKEVASEKSTADAENTTSKGE